MQRKPTPSLSLDSIAAALAPFRVSLTQAQVESIRAYISILLVWNQSVNLTAIEDPVEIVTRHFGESLFAGSFLRFGPCRLADVGTGAGFPGLPLKIAYPSIRLTLIESNAKKCAFLTEVVQRLGLQNVDIWRHRYDEGHRTGELFNFVCSRALGDYGQLLRWARGVMKPGGQVILWIGTDDSIRVGRIKEWSWDTPIAIPDSRRRIILVGRPRLYA